MGIVPWARRHSELHLGALRSGAPSEPSPSPAAWAPAGRRTREGSEGVLWRVVVASLRGVSAMGRRP
eukprot:14565562-Alexandrium_andersonii.AAC.1